MSSCSADTRTVNASPCRNTLVFSLFFSITLIFLLFLELNSSNMESAGKKTVVPAEIHSDNDFVLCQLLLESRCDVEIKSLLYKR